MAKLIYSAISSLDGYVEDAEGNFDWGRPDDELFAFINDLERPIGTYLYGRRMYETMVFWETVATGAAIAVEQKSRTARRMARDGPASDDAREPRPVAVALVRRGNGQLRLTLGDGLEVRG
jgi:dihydrofolate reductase